MSCLQLGIVFALVCMKLEAAPNAGTTKMCYDCDKVKHGSDCTNIMKCHHGENTCYSKVTFLNGQYLLTRGCKHQEDCTNTGTAVIGKRRPHEHGQVVCQSCCDSGQCNSKGCDQYLTPAATTVPTTAANLAPCRDHESDGFLCADYDSLNFCTASSSLSHKLALERCPDHCGFCDPSGNFLPQYRPTTIPSTTTLKTTTKPCVDHEEDGFVCADYDQYNFCTDKTGVAYKLALERCPKHCGFCNANPVGFNNRVADSWNEIRLHICAGRYATTINVVNIVLENGPTTTQSTTCQDFEDAQFTCAQWASYGFCGNISGVGHDVAVKRCSKYCGFCS